MTDLATHMRTRMDGTVVLAVLGEVDFVSLDAFHAAMAEALARRPARLVLDLTLVTFMDSTGMGALIKVHRDAVAAGVGMVVQPGPFVLRLLGVAGLLDHLPLDPPAPRMPYVSP